MTTQKLQCKMKCLKLITYQRIFSIGMFLGGERDPKHTLFYPRRTPKPENKKNIEQFWISPVEIKTMAETFDTDWTSNYVPHTLICFFTPSFTFNVLINH